MSASITWGSWSGFRFPSVRAHQGDVGVQPWLDHDRRKKRSIWKVAAAFRRMCWRPIWYQWRGYTGYAGELASRGRSPVR